MKKNDLYTVEISDMNNLGAGICKIDGKVVFVRGGVTGDKLEIGIIKSLSDYAVARVNKIIESSPIRSENDCPSFKRCGGCSFRHVKYESEKIFKKNYVENAFKKVGLSVEVEDILSTGHPDRYRNKVQYPVGKDWRIGFFAEHSHDIVEVSDCLAQDGDFTEILDEIVKFGKEKNIEPYDFESGKGLVRHIYLRKGRGSGEIMVCLVANGKKLPNSDELCRRLTSRFPDIKSIILNINEKRTNVILGDKNTTLWGKDTIDDIFCGLKVKISPLSFYQVNRECAELICKKASELADLKAGESLVDLFCGIGTIGLSMIKNFPDAHLIGVEIIPDAVENAKENAAANGMTNARFICGDANSPEITDADVIVVDPPRKGCSAELIKRISETSPSRVIYVSCNPDTLARDCKLFDTEGYAVTKAFAADMFSRTGHVETVVLLSHLKSTDHIKVELDLSDEEPTVSESKGTYDDIKKYIYKRYQVKVSSLYISQVKRKLGLPVGECYNKPKSDDARVPNCPEEKERMIVEALRYFKMI